MKAQVAVPDRLLRSRAAARINFNLGLLAGLALGFGVAAGAAMTGSHLWVVAVCCLSASAANLARVWWTR